MSILDQRFYPEYTFAQNGPVVDPSWGFKEVVFLITPSFFISNKNVGEGFKLLSFGHF